MPAPEGGKATGRRYIANSASVSECLALAVTVEGETAAFGSLNSLTHAVAKTRTADGVMGQPWPLGCPGSASQFPRRCDAAQPMASAI